MKKFIISLICIIIILSSVLIIFSLDLTKRSTPEKPTVLQNVQVYPICFLLDGDIKFNPMLPYGNEMDTFTIDASMAAFIPNSTISLFFDKENLSNVSYEIIDPLLNEIVATNKIKESNKTPYDQGIELKLSLPTLKTAYRYVLKVILEEKPQSIYYYQSFIVDENTQNVLLEAILQTHRGMFNGNDDGTKRIVGNRQDGAFYNANQNSSERVLLWKSPTHAIKMNEPVANIKAYDPLTLKYQVEMTFTVASRVDYDFEYWDFKETFEGVVSKDGVTISGYRRVGNRKNEPYFDGEILKWVVDEGFPQMEMDTLNSENGRYMTFVYGNQIYLLDKTYNALVKVFGFDQLDSDYIMDEDDNHAIKLLKIEDTGNISYMVYGYMPAGKVAGNNGVLVGSYDQSSMENKNEFFVKLPYGFKTLKYYIENTSYYNKKGDHYYWVMENQLFGLDLQKKVMKNMGNISGYIKYSRDGLIYTVDSLSKENNGIQLMNLTGDTLGTSLLVYENELTRVIGTFKGKVVVGTYTLKNSYEYLNGSVFYPFNSIKILDYVGEVIKEMKPQTGTYYQDVVLNHEGYLSATVYQLKRQIANTPNLSKVAYEKVEEQQSLFEWEVTDSQKNISVIALEEKEGMNRMLVDYASIQLSREALLIAKEAKNGKVKVLEEKIQPIDKLFEVYINNQFLGVTNRIDEALLKIKNSGQGLIFERDRNGKRALIYHEAVVPSKVRWVAPMFSQYPELVRGCEVTALSMFLSYYLGSNIDKMTLSNQIRIDETPETKIDGMISFGDMHKGFVGSITERTKPGLGVYVEPLYDLAKNYVAGVYNLTGSSFEQVLSFVGNEGPVLVITPGHYNSVPTSLIQNWMTPSGYMEVTYKEHSVLIVGYDDQFVYFNDPNNGKLNKQTIEAFQAGWENQGSQALVVIN